MQIRETKLTDTIGENIKKHYISKDGKSLNSTALESAVAHIKRTLVWYAKIPPTLEAVTDAANLDDLRRQWVAERTKGEETPTALERGNLVADVCVDSYESL